MIVSHGDVLLPLLRLVARVANPIAMEHAEVELLLGGEMGDTGREPSLERPVIRPFGKGAVDVGVVNVWFASGVFRNGQALPRHAGIKDPQDEVEKAMRGEFVRWIPFRSREMREDKCGELGFRPLHGNGRYCRLCSRGAPHVRAAGEGLCSALEN